MVIKNCTECKETGKTQAVRAESSSNHPEQSKVHMPPPPSLPSAAPSIAQPSGTMTAENRFISEESGILAEHHFEHKSDPFSPHAQQNIHGPVPSMEDYHDIAIDPQIMQQLQSQMNAQYPHSDDAYEPTGMAHFNDPEQIHNHHHHHHAHSAEYQVDDSDDHHLMAHAAASMDLVDGTHLDQEEQIPQHLLQGGYVDTDGNTHFDQ